MAVVQAWIRARTEQAPGPNQTARAGRFGVELLAEKGDGNAVGLQTVLATNLSDAPVLVRDLAVRVVTTSGSRTGPSASGSLIVDEARYLQPGESATVSSGGGASDGSMLLVEFADLGRVGNGRVVFAQRGVSTSRAREDAVTLTFADPVAGPLRDGVQVVGAPTDDWGSEQAWQRYSAGYSFSGELPRPGLLYALRLAPNIEDDSYPGIDNMAGFDVPPNDGVCSSSWVSIPWIRARDRVPRTSSARARQNA